MSNEEPRTPGVDGAAPAAEPRASWRSRLRLAGAVAVYLASCALVADAAVESWQAGSPLRDYLAGGAALFFVLVAYVLAKGGRVGGRGWLMDPVVPGVVFLGFVLGCCQVPEGVVRGIVVAGQPAPVVLSAAMLALVVAAAARLSGPGGATSWWLRLPIVLAGAYAACSFAVAARTGAPFQGLLTGRDFWGGLPWWGQGTWIGAFVLVPVALVREVGAAIARLAFFPYVRWMFVFGMACAIAYSASILR